ncbi:MAG: hypothetical protein JWO31_1707, partial [Phycisphaerales bacterium]|nr:hypothetical protein [Phycisphaerales bacterium]
MSDSSGAASHLPPSAPKTEAVRRLLEERGRRLSRGEVVLDRELLIAHPELAPDLYDALAATKAIRRALLDARRAGPADHSLLAMSDGALLAPLSAGGGWDAEEPDPVPSAEGYEVVGEVGSGGQARVYEAVQRSTGQRVAIKVLPGGPLAGSRQRERFERESAILAALRHPHIVGIVDRGRTADGSFFFVMPFVAGRALDEYVAGLRAAGTATPATVLRLFARVAAAVGESHRLGIIHRDLK